MHERPTIIADRAGRQYAATKSDEHKKTHGQYLTPEPVAEFMAGLYAPPKKDCIRVLDPGAGTGVLSCAILERLVGTPHIHLTAYEFDKGLLPLLHECLDYARRWLATRGTELVFDIRTADFVLDNAHHMDGSLFHCTEEPYDVVISNPPYFKLNKADARAQAASFVVHGQPNIYAIFMAISAYMLRSGGELVFIVPRSFAAGPYFRLFRERFFALMRPEHIHLFGSRKDAFAKDEVLQEHVILRAKRQDGWKATGRATITSSAGVGDLLDRSHRRSALLRDLVDLATVNKHLFIPTSDHDEQVIELVHSWHGNLHAFGFEISTGPVVPFRATEFITSDEATPLLWMQHVVPMQVRHPIPMRKQQYIVSNDDSAYLLLPNKNYVLLRRFSAKEEERRLIAAPYIAGEFQPHDLVGFENHVNYIHKPKGELSVEEAYGIAALLNCRILDDYFRTYNGNTQVSATELRSTPLPPLETIRQIGAKVREARMSNGILNDYVSTVLMNRGNDGKAGRRASHP
ncbi:MAG TPA: Eco57I restriction-modification methylase domain-containing protein [Syntrophobacteraceae bacterium]|nr:Eco57I restriction-modification methylase domain-containing protein [Syntrophobacteraceae bacterium]